MSRSRAVGDTSYRTISLRRIEAMMSLSQFMIVVKEGYSMYLWAAA